MREKCKEACAYYIQNKSVNNCSQYPGTTVQDDDTTCYKIQYGHK